jgi:hypothetical protein
LGLEKYAFIHERVKNQHIFKVYLSQRIDSSSTFVSDEFKNCLLENELKRFEFEEVWDSEKS